jgi:hypothetical protein
MVSMLTPFMGGRTLPDQDLTGQINAEALASLVHLRAMWVSYDMMIIIRSNYADFNSLITILLP